jgi:hypothetical protein
MAHLSRDDVIRVDDVNNKLFRAYLEVAETLPHVQKLIEMNPSYALVRKYEIQLPDEMTTDEIKICIRQLAWTVSKLRFNCHRHQAYIGLESEGLYRLCVISGTEKDSDTTVLHTEWSGNISWFAGLFPSTSDLPILQTIMDYIKRGMPVDRRTPKEVSHPGFAPIEQFDLLALRPPRHGFMRAMSVITRINGPVLVYPLHTSLAVHIMEKDVDGILIQAPIGDACKWLVQNNLIHVNVCPQTIMIDENRKPMLYTGSWSVWPIHSVIHGGGISQYASPQVLGHKPVDEETHRWGLAISQYELEHFENVNDTDDMVTIEEARLRITNKEWVDEVLSALVGR